MGVRHVFGLLRAPGRVANARCSFAGGCRRWKYFVRDTGAELLVTREYLPSRDSFLNKPTTRFKSGRPFEDCLEVYRGALSPPQVRWYNARYVPRAHDR